MPTDVIMAALIGGGSAAIVNGAFTIVNNFLTRRSDDRKHIQELATQMAMDQWKFIYERCQTAPVDLEALVVTAINAANIVAFVGSGSTSEREIRKELTRGFDRTTVVQEVYEERRKQKMMPKK